MKLRYGPCLLLYAALVAAFAFRFTESLCAQEITPQCDWLVTIRSMDSQGLLHNKAALVKAIAQCGGDQNADLNETTFEGIAIEPSFGTLVVNGAVNVPPDTDCKPPKCNPLPPPPPSRNLCRKGHESEPYCGALVWARVVKDPRAVAYDWSKTWFDCVTYESTFPGLCKWSDIDPLGNEVIYQDKSKPIRAYMCGVYTTTPNCSQFDDPAWWAKYFPGVPTQSQQTLKVRWCSHPWQTPISCIKIDGQDARSMWTFGGDWQ